MMGSDDVWRWLVRGMGGLTGQIVNMYQDPAAGPMPDALREDFERYLGQLNEVAQQQREKHGNDGHR